MKCLMRVAPIAFLGFLAACAAEPTMQPVERNAQTVAADETVVVFGLKYPERLAIAEAEVLADRSVIARLDAGAVKTDSGYAVMRLPAGRRYMVKGVFAEHPQQFYGQYYNFCEQGEVLTFRAPAGQVVYYGELEPKRVNSAYYLTPGYDLLSAAAFLKAVLPGFASQLQAEHFDKRRCLSATPQE